MSEAEHNQQGHEPFLNPPQGAAEKVRAVIEPAIAALGAELVLLQYVRGAKQTTLRLFCDEAGEGTIGLDKLTALNRTLGHLLEVEDEHQKLFGAAWNLEVSSPGVDRPLAKKSHFEKAVGERVKVKARASIDGKRTFTGALSAVDVVNGITVTADDGESTALSWDDIDDAHVVFVFGTATQSKAPGRGKRAKATSKSAEATPKKAKNKGKGKASKEPNKASGSSEGRPDTGAQ